MPTCHNCGTRTESENRFCGQCGQELSTVTQAKTADEKAVELLLKGVEFHFAGDLDNALSLFLQAKKIAPKRPDVYENIGNIYRDAPDFKKAIKNYKRAIKLDPESSSAYAGRGVTYHEAGYTGKALKDFNRALELEPTDPHVLFSRAAMFIDGGNIDAAMVDLELLIREEPEFGQAYLNRGFIFQQQEDFRRAEADYQRAIELMDDPEAIKTARVLLQQVI